jgi:hypothetical protein
MNSVEKLWSSPKLRLLLAVQLRYQLVSSNLRVIKTFYSHIQCANVLSIEMYQNYFREDTNADQSCCAAKLVSSRLRCHILTSLYYYFMLLSLVRGLSSLGNSLEPTVIPTTRASNFRLHHFPYYV